MDAEGEGKGEGGTCLSKLAEENEGSSEGGMLCILNAQIPVRWVEEAPDISIGFG